MVSHSCSIPSELTGNGQVAMSNPQAHPEKYKQNSNWAALQHRHEYRPSPERKDLAISWFALRRFIADHHTVSAG